MVLLALLWDRLNVASVAGALLVVGGSALCALSGSGYLYIMTTRKHYVPVLSSRLKQASERLAGRFGWQVTPPPARKLAEVSPVGTIH